MTVARPSSWTQSELAVAEVFTGTYIQQPRSSWLARQQRLAPAADRRGPHFQSHGRREVPSMNQPCSAARTLSTPNAAEIRHHVVCLSVSWGDTCHARKINPQSSSVACRQHTRMHVLDLLLCVVCSRVCVCPYGMT